MNRVITCMSIFGCAIWRADDIYSAVLQLLGATQEHGHTQGFLGEYASKVLNMKPEELEEFMYWLVEQRIDHDRDMKVDIDELKHWMEHVYHSDVDKQITDEFFRCNLKKDYDISFKEYRACLMSNPNQPSPTEKSENRLILRWRQADQDGDGKLTLGEFAPFYRPEEPHHQLMHTILTDEYFEDSDLNSDFLISLEEFLESSQERYTWNYPRWSQDVEEELTQTQIFKNADKNGDGHLNQPEIEEFLFPIHHDPADDEAQHIFGEVDDNKDGYLTHEEIMKHLKLFVGSQAMQHGKIFLRNRDEL